MVLDYSVLPQAEQAQVVVPRHVFPLISVEKTPDTGELVLATKLYGKEKKEVHCIPYFASIITGACTFFPMFMGMLPATSLATLAASAPDMKVGDWRSWGDWFTANWPKWFPDARVLWQAEVCDQVRDIDLQVQWSAMPIDEFVSMVCGDHQIQGKHKLKELVLWYAIYSQWSKATGKLPIYDLRMDVEESALDECPVKAADWTRLQAGVVKSWKVSLQNKHARDPEPSWKRVLDRSSSASDGQPSADAAQLDSILEDVQYYPAAVVGDAGAALKELMLAARVDSKMVRGFDNIKQPRQLQVGLRLLLSRITPAQKKQLSPQLAEWNAACSQLVPAEDLTAFLKSANAILTKATTSVNWFEVGAHMLLAGIDLPDKCDGFQEVTDAKSMQRAVAQVAQHAHSKVQFRVVLKELAEAVPQGAEGEHEEPTDEFDRFWQSPRKHTAQAPATAEERPPLPPKEQPNSGETVSETYTAVPQSQVKDGVVVRLFSLTNTHTSRRYRQAIQDVFGVSCNLNDYQVNRG